MATLRAFIILVIFVTATLLLAPLQWFAIRLDWRLQRSLPYRFHRFLCRLLGIRVTVVGEPLKNGGLIAANHVSWLDIPVLSSVVPLSFIAKNEVRRWPFFGTQARLQRTVFVRRERAKALEDRDTIRKRLMQGDTLVLFPEGTSSDGNRVLPFKSALFSAAELSIGNGAGRHERHAPVQPVSVAYTGLYGVPMGRENRPFFAWYGDMDLVPHLWEAFKKGPIDVVVELHPPLTIDDAGGRKKLAARAEAAVRQGLVRALAGSREPPPARDEELIEALAENGIEVEAA